jgi:metal-responsive CopG/Arc/MetJ family transcriptional regulator
MPARPVQISLEEALLERVDKDPETRSLGRSAFVRRAVEHYLEAKRRSSIDDALRKGYAGKAAEADAEIEDLMTAQAWPDK